MQKCQHHPFHSRMGDISVGCHALSLNIHIVCVYEYSGACSEWSERRRRKNTTNTLFVSLSRERFPRFLISIPQIYYTCLTCNEFSPQWFPITNELIIQSSSGKRDVIKAHDENDFGSAQHYACGVASFLTKTKVTCTRNAHLSNESQASFTSLCSIICAFLPYLIECYYSFEIFIFEKKSSSSCVRVVVPYTVDGKWI